MLVDCMGYIEDYLHGGRDRFIYFDKGGYMRDWGKRNDLVHRIVAYEDLMEKRLDLPPGFKFGNMEVHHIDGNIRNNHPSNLQVLTKQEHDDVHDFIEDTGIRVRYHSELEELEMWRALGWDKYDLGIIDYGDYSFEVNESAREEADAEACYAEYLMEHS